MRNRGGPAEIRTLDPQLARLMLYQLSYRPTIEEKLRPLTMVGQGRLELPTSRLSGVYSNQLSYWPQHNESGKIKVSHYSVKESCHINQELFELSPLKLILLA